MASTDLVFERPLLANPADLVFGDDSGAGDVALSFAITLPLSFSAVFVPPIGLSVVASLPLAFSASLGYSNDVARPVVGSVVSLHQTAMHTHSWAQSGIAQAGQMPSGVQADHETARAVQSSSASGMQDAPRVVGGASNIGHQNAVPVRPGDLRSGFAGMLRDVRLGVSSRQQDGVKTLQSSASGFADMLHDRRARLHERWQDGVTLVKSRGEQLQSANKLSGIRTAKHQNAMRPRAGVTPPVVPPADPCYIPDSNLVFEAGAATSGNLIFWCERHDTIAPRETAIVPIRSVYVVINNVNVRRVEGNVTLQALSVSMSIDVDSWTWNFSATIPEADRVHVQRAPGDPPVELEVNINGNLYRVLAESLSRDRSFAQNAVQIRGRGKSARLSAPFAPVLTFANSIQRTAQQLMADVLTFNNVPLGWDVDWQLSDWLVPAGAFAMQGSYIDGLSAIAGAAGAYLQPHPTDDVMRVLLRYPVAPWEWDAADADFELPASAAINEGIEWIDRAEYNRVFVSGTSHGIVGQITRAGTGGDLVAPMVSDPLITAAAAARQRGLSILGNTGRKANVTLRYPVLPESGVITPGKMVRYVDGADMLYGIVRGTSISAQFSDVFQTIQMEVQL